MKSTVVGDAAAGGVQSELMKAAAIHQNFTEDDILKEETE